MDHTEALRAQLAEKYVLGELTATLRDDYEEHYFNCAACALDVKALSTFMDVSCETLRGETEVQERGAVAARVTKQTRAKGEWFAWLRPAWAVPVFAALLLVIGYQNMVTIPGARGAAILAPGQELRGYSLQLANTRSEEGVLLRVSPQENFTLDFDFTPTKHFESYSYILQDDGGRTVFQRDLPGDKANKELRLAVAGGTVHPGTYSLIFFGGAAPGFRPSAENEVSRLRFKIEFLQ